MSMICDYSVSVIALKKNERKYGMTCAWFMPVDYDKLVCLLGTQSQTGHAIEKGDIIGVSVLNKSKEQIVLLIETNKKRLDNLIELIKKKDSNAFITIKETRTIINGYIS